MSHGSTKWLQLGRMLGRNPSTPLATQEGQLRHERSSTTTGKLYLGRFLTGGTYEWHELTDNLPLAGGTVTGDVTFQGNVTIGNSQADTLILGSHIQATGADPTLTATPVGTYPAAGTTPSGLAVTAGNDSAMELAITTGTGPGTGLLMHVAFATTRASSSYGVWIQPRTSGAAQLLMFATSRGAAGFDVTCPVAPAASTALAFFVWIIEF